VAEPHPEPVDAHGRARQAGAQRGGDALRLLRVDAQQPQGPHQLGQVVGGRGGQHEGAAAVQHPADLRAVARGEHVQHQRGDAVAQRQATPDVAAHAEDAGPAAGVPHGGLRAVEGHARAAGQRRHDTRQVVGGARAHLHDRPGHGRVEGVPRGPREGGGQRRKVAGVHHRRPVGHHRRRVAPRAGVAVQEGDGAAAGHVEGVSARAAQGLPAGEPSAAQRAGQQPGVLGSHHAGGPGGRGDGGPGGIAPSSQDPRPVARRRGWGGFTGVSGRLRSP
jgi:hypothetical protein